MGKTYAEIIASDFKDKIVEILIGESYEELHLDQMSSHYPASIIGKVISANGNALILNCIYVNINFEHSFGKKVYVNDYSIKFVSEIGKGSMEDLLVSRTDIKKIKQMIENNEIK